MTARAFAVAALLAAACVPGEGPLMAPNQDCLGCHGRGEAQGWTVAGTYGGRGSRVTITDANGKSLTLHTARNGNFYTAEPVTFPLRVAVDGREMQDPVRKYGGCNVCHGPGGAVIPGELMAPGTDCLFCHDGSGATTVFTSAGTWPGPAGQTVTLSDGVRTIALQTNAAGNFYTSDPISFPFTARVGGSTMDPPVTYGGCNECHGRGGDDD
jgi:predicted CXXCH cytochrome family protein